MTLRLRASLLFVLLWVSLLFAQEEPRTVPPASDTGSVASRSDRPTNAATVSPSDPADLATLSPILDRLNRAAQMTAMDIGNLQIGKWKVDGSQKQQAQERADSLQRNLTAAVPELTQKALAAPGELAPTFRLYRNLNVLFDVLASTAESAGAFGPKDRYDRLSSDVEEMSAIRRQLAERLDSMAVARDSEVANLRARTRALAAQAQANTPVKKVVVDDTKPASSKPKKKAKPATAPAAQGGEAPKQ